MSGTATRDWAAILAGITALGVLIFGATATHGWLETIVVWQLHLFGLLMIGIALYKGATRWLLLIVPVFLIPLCMGAMLLYACSQGDCL